MQYSRGKSASQWMLHEMFLLETFTWVNSVSNSYVCLAVQDNGGFVHCCTMWHLTVVAVVEVKTWIAWKESTNPTVSKHVCVHLLMNICVSLFILLACNRLMSAVWPHFPSSIHRAYKQCMYMLSCVDYQYLVRVQSSRFCSEEVVQPVWGHPHHCSHKWTTSTVHWLQCA